MSKDQNQRPIRKSKVLGSIIEGLGIAAIVALITFGIMRSRENGYNAIVYNKNYATGLCSYTRFETILNTYLQFGDQTKGDEVARYIMSRPLYCEDMIKEYEDYMYRTNYMYRGNEN